MDRRIFIHSGALTILGCAISPTITFSKTNTENINAVLLEKTPILKYCKSQKLNSLSFKFQEAIKSYFIKSNANILEEYIYKLGRMYFIPVRRENQVFQSNYKLLLAYEDNSEFKITLIKDEFVEEYAIFIQNLEKNISSFSNELNLEQVITPEKIVKSKVDDSFSFLNRSSNTITFKIKKGKTYTMIS